MNAVVVDTNILFSMLLSRQGRLRDILFHAGNTRFYCCRFSIVELFKHKQKLLGCSKLEEPDLLEALNVILGRLSFYERLPQSQAITDADIAREIDDDRRGRRHESIAEHLR